MVATAAPALAQEATVRNQQPQLQPQRTPLGQVRTLCCALPRCAAVRVGHALNHCMAYIHALCTMHYASCHDGGHALIVWSDLTDHSISSLISCPLCCAVLCCAVLCVWSHSWVHPVLLYCRPTQCSDQLCGCCACCLCKFLWKCGPDC